jgi:hypothetical protein
MSAETWTIVQILLGSAIGSAIACLLVGMYWVALFHKPGDPPLR